MGLRDHVFPLERHEDHGYTLAGQRRGPFASHEAAEVDLLQLLKGWSARAESLGGWCWRKTEREIVLTVPENVPIEGGRPLHTLPNTVGV
jgi:hypothetical protein